MVHKHPLLETIVSYVYVCSLLSSTGAISVHAQMPEKGTGSLRARVIGSCEPTHVDSKN